MSDAPNSPTPSSRRLEQAAASDSSITAVHVQLLREKPEPTEGFSPIPIFILFVFSALILVGGIYLGVNSAHFSALSFDVKNQQVASSGSSAPQEVDMMKTGERLYGQTCVACHQINGMGVPGAFPPLVGSPYVLENEERLIKIVAHGLSGPIEVLGASYNSVMPAFYGPTSAYRYNELKIAAVLTYVRGSWGNNAAPVTPEKVKEVLAATGTRATAWTVGELGGN